MMLQTILSGCLFDTGVKKLATAFSDESSVSRTHGTSRLKYLLVVVDSNFLFFEGGGESDSSLLGASICQIQEL